MKDSNQTDTKAFEYSKLISFLSLFLCACALQAQIIMGADQIGSWYPQIKGKRIALVVNQTSVIGKVHLADSLKKLKANVSCILAPEHGFRGEVEAGGHVGDGKDKKTGYRIISLYGNHRKPTPADLANTDIVLFDIQDVGARFYTYISTLHYVMEACAENNKQLIVLDRPNPNGDYVDGPILDTAYRSFIGMHPVPIVHGLTIGEYAGMINGERWLKNGVQCSLRVVKMKHYTHTTPYILPIRPSPNLPTATSIRLYPSVCLFEGTTVSLGRGTDWPFEVVGKPGYNKGKIQFTPRVIKGVSENPPFLGKNCSGHRLTPFAETIFPYAPHIYLSWLIDFYEQDTSKKTFFTPFFDQLAGTDQLRKDIVAGKSEEDIRKSWKPALHRFYDTRLKYLLYPDFVKTDY